MAKSRHWHFYRLSLRPAQFDGTNGIADINLTFYGDPFATPVLAVAALARDVAMRYPDARRNPALLAARRTWATKPDAGKFSWHAPDGVVCVWRLATCTGLCKSTHEAASQQAVADVTQHLTTKTQPRTER